MDQRTKDLMELIVAVETRGCCDNEEPAINTLVERIKARWTNQQEFKYGELMRRKEGKA